MYDKHLHRTDADKTYTILYIYLFNRKFVFFRTFGFWPFVVRWLLLLLLLLVAATVVVFIRNVFIFFFAVGPYIIIPSYPLGKLLCARFYLIFGFTSSSSLFWSNQPHHHLQGGRGWPTEYTKWCVCMLRCACVRHCVNAQFQFSFSSWIMV